ncbi:MAG: NADH:flavin oxidoreductase [Deferrisomatales bacterium]
MPQLFAPARIGSLSARNRFVRSATYEGLAGPGGAVTDELVQVLTALARGGVGTVVTGHAFVRADGRAGPRQLGLHDDALLPGLGRLAAAVRAGGALAVAQLAHAGLHAPALPRVGPSAGVDGRDGPGQELSRADIAALASAFAAAAARAQAAGFDAVQVHAAHTYLLSQFLSPHYNRRTDAYGGPVEHRARAVLEVVAAVRAAVGPGYPVWVKINAADFLEGGLSQADSAAACRLLDRAGIDAIELSGGNLSVPRFRPARPGRIGPGEEGYYREAARALKAGLRCPLILVGGIRSLETAETFVADGVADFIALCRPLIAEPGLVARWQAGDRAPARCVSDNRCYEPFATGEGVRCVTLEGTGAGGARGG